MSALLLVAAPAGAGQAAACAAFWQAVADVWRAYPALGVPPGDAQALADGFREQATDEAEIRAQLPGLRAMVRAHVAGDRQSRAIFLRRAESCAEPALPPDR